MALVYGNQFAGGGYVSLFGKASVHNTAYGKLGESQAYTSADTNGISLAKVDNINGGSNVDLENLYNNIGSILDDIMKKISLGNFDEINIDDINDLTNKLNNQQTTTNNSNFNNFKDTFTNVINLVIVANEQKEQNNILEDRINIADEKAGILDDPEKLQQYIYELKKKSAFYLFNLPDISTVSANVKPEYSEYFKLYGVPVNLEFDQEKLDAIINKIYG